MARKRKNKEGASTTSIVLAALLLLAVVWYTGLFDKLLNLVHPASQGIMRQQTTTQQNSAQTASSQHGFMYANLSDADREIYNAMYKAFTTREDQNCPTVDSGRLGDVRDCVLADHPEIFYASNVKARSSSWMSRVWLSGDFTYSPEDAKAAQRKLEKAASACIDGMPSGADDYDKAKYFYEYLVSHVEYDHEVARSASASSAHAGQTAVDALVNGRAVCGGYAHAYEYLMQRAGIPCVYVSGAARSENHAWCAARLDGEWYFIDPTWGDSQFLKQNGEMYEAGIVNYDYLCVPEVDISATHALDKKHPMPSCTSMNDNYYVREGAYFNNVDLNRAAALVGNALKSGSKIARLRCADASTYARMFKSLITDGGIHQMYGGSSYRYLSDDALHTITILFE